MSLTLKKYLINGCTVLFLTLIFLYIFAETNYIHNKNILFEQASFLEIFVSSLALFILLWMTPIGYQSKGLKAILISIKSVLIFLVLFLIFVETTIIDFSGLLFGPEAIYHFSIDSFLLGVQEYFWPFVLLLLFIGISVWVMIKTCHDYLTFKTTWVLFLASALLFSLYFNYNVIGRYYDGIQKYLALRQVKAVNEKQIEQLKPLGISTLSANKIEIQASHGNQKNLIIIYLESFSHVFTTSERYPNLTPNINQLKSKYSHFDPYISTAHFTMDGLISSLCGFIPNMALGNNALNTGEKNYYFIPCLPDILQKAGYHQEFIGGAKKSFAGKTSFLEDHGFDRVWGWEDFEHQEAFSSKDSHSWWGLHDDDLFDFTLQKIQQLHSQKTLFHLSVLTLSTHLSGFPAPSCTPYDEEAHKYINAIHCTDQLLGNFINKLDEQDVLNDTVVFITGDHAVFNNSLTQDLFGSQVSSKNILGLMINTDKSSPIAPMGLYDMAPILLDSLQIKHNVTFINGQAKPFSEDRLLITRSQLFKGNVLQELSKNCHSDPSYTSPLDTCSHHDTINKIHGYTQLFGLSIGQKYNADSVFEVMFTDDQSRVEEITLNGKSLKGDFRRDGFLLEKKHFNKPGVFFVQFDPNTKSLKNPVLLNIANNPIDTINKMLKNNDIPYFIFGTNHKENHDFMQQLELDKKMACISSNICVYQLQQLGHITSHPTETKVTLSFGN